MEYVRLLNTDLLVSRIGFGSEPLGGTDWGQVDERLAMAAVSRALELGVTLFDTADVYGLGKAEELLSRALGAKRHEVVIISKFGLNWRQNNGGGRATTFRDCSPRRVVTALEGSLRRLRIDSLPVYMIHWPDPNTPIDETIGELIKCKQAGKIQWIGVSNFPVSLLHQANAINALAGLELPYNLVDRKAEDQLLPECQALGISVLAYGPLAQGLLTGKYGPASRFQENDRRHRLPHFSENGLLEILGVIDRLREVGQHYGKAPVQVAIRWVLGNPSVACAIVGAKSPEQVEMNVGAAGWQLSPSDRECLPAPGPYGRSPSASTALRHRGVNPIGIPGD